MLKILTLNWNGKEKLEKLYPSLINALDGIDYQYLIKDNGSVDESVSFIKSLNNPKVKVIEYGHNRDNFAQGCNLLFKESDPKDDDLILLLNNDVIFNDKKSIHNMMNMFKDPEVGLVGAKLKFVGTNLIQHGGVVFSKSNGLPMHFKAHQQDDKSTQKHREFQAVTGAVWMTTASLYNQICQTNKSGQNGLDEGFFWCFEDISAGLSIKYSLGKKVVYCGTTDIFHEESATLKKNPANKLFMNHNINHFRTLWRDKYLVDEEVFAKNANHNVYEMVK
jgi:GT2 family glycosyltransferase